jgi:hypothetical protein
MNFNSSGFSTDIIPRKFMKYWFYCWLCVIRMIKPRRMRWAGHVARMGEKKNADRVLVGSPEGNKPQRRTRPPMWEDNIKMDLREIGWCGMDWIHLAQ